MHCRYPYFLPSLSIYVPCGRCTSCRVTHARMWSVRLLHESSYYDHSIFATFTYDNGHLPLNNSLNKAEFQRFMKRLRKQVNEPIKYYACGEYGDQLNRPHYHAIIFGMSQKQKILITAAWQMGFVYLGNVTIKSCRYVAQYIDKKYNGSLGEQVYTNKGLEKPFQLQSKGLGLRFAQENADYLKSNLGCTVNGSQVGIPRYYRKKLDIDVEQFAIKSKEVQSKLRDKYSYLSDSDFALLQLKMRDQYDKNLKARMSLKKKKL
nr:MAG: replication initiator protein [Microviridae sp.]